MQSLKRVKKENTEETFTFPTCVSILTSQHLTNILTGPSEYFSYKSEIFLIFPEITPMFCFSKSSILPMLLTMKALKYSNNEE